MNVINDMRLTKILVQGHDSRRTVAALGSHVKRPEQCNLQSVGVKSQINFQEWLESTLLVLCSFLSLFISSSSSSFMFLFFYLPIPFFQVLLSVYIPPHSFHPHHTRVGWIPGISLCPIQHLLELPLGSCKAAPLLFRYHLHINVARELVGKSLMRRQLQLQIFVYLISFLPDRLFCLWW